MKTILIILIVFSTVQTWATTWAPVYPYTQKTEKGNVKTKSFPYDPFHGGNGPGETFVYYKGELLYTIDKYFTTPFFTYENGKYLVAVDFYFNFQNPIEIYDENGEAHADPINYDGDAVKIYENGELRSTIKFSDLKIDTSRININKFGNWFSWNYRSNNSENKKMEDFPAFLSKGELNLITSDNQLVKIDIKSAKQTSIKNAEDYFDQKEKWKPTKSKRKYHKVRYPDKFSLPKLQSGKSIDQALSEFLKKELSDENSDNATVKIYFHTLLINKKGECEDVSVSPSTKSDMNKGSSHSYDERLKDKIEKWVLKQKYDAKTIPKHFLKFKYSDFVYSK